MIFFSIAHNREVFNDVAVLTILSVCWTGHCLASFAILIHVFWRWCDVDVVFDWKFSVWAEIFDRKSLLFVLYLFWDEAIGCSSFKDDASMCIVYMYMPHLNSFSIFHSFLQQPILQFFVIYHQNNLIHSFRFLCSYNICSIVSSQLNLGQIGLFSPAKM